MPVHSKPATRLAAVLLLGLLCACATPVPGPQASNEVPPDCERIQTVGSNISKLVCTTRTEEDRRRDIDAVRDATRTNGMMRGTGR